ncbi:hypothetical protein [Pinisolibacter aquiterrae]|uniref:hypothetical protein n=1 Tax=Pinisolibacter aquiterrae TaxID=2815579 RepID=UPI001C3E6722|nr:hypothetical protein [Pinisolibacter aquiterrae]MBV5262956.1 hypothetical protein [Pinisolibacter aquiterrae]MCC8235298.1 hypothetical protein [Pinisolibacter aquiterrae]
MGFESAQGVAVARRGGREAVSPLDGRFLIWRGASGRAYVFSPIAVDDAGFEDTGLDGIGLDDAVLIAVERDRAGRPTAARVVADRSGRPGEIWAHHLATTAAARRRAVIDLTASGREPELFGAIG